MHKFPIFNYKRFSELPLKRLDNQKFSIYLIDFNWNYLFANIFSFQVHNKERSDLVGQNLWQLLKEKMDVDTEFKSFVRKIQEGQPASIQTISAFSKKRVDVSGYPLEDCYYFAVTILPDKEDLINELRSQLGKFRSK